MLLLIARLDAVVSFLFKLDTVHVLGNVNKDYILKGKEHAEDGASSIAAVQEFLASHQVRSYMYHHHS